MSVTIIVVNKINNKSGIMNILKFSITKESNFSGPICIKAIRIHEIYPIHLIGFESFDIAFKYSCIAIAAIIAKNTSTTYLFPSVRTNTTNGKPSKAEVILFISIFFLIFSILIRPKFPGSFLIFDNCFI